MLTNDDGRQVRVHRFVWELANGPVPARLVVCHACDRRSCVALEHLFLGAPAANTADMVAKGRQRAPSGEKHYAARLTTVAARAIREDRVNGLTFAALAQKYGVSLGAIQAVVHMRTWKAA